MAEELVTEDGIVLKDEERMPCEVWSRVMGYHRPVSAWNVGKVGEFRQRKYFDVDMAVKKATEGDNANES